MNASFAFIFRGLKSLVMTGGVVTSGNSLPHDAQLEIGSEFSTPQ
jgi:hypothetical protein